MSKAHPSRAAMLAGMLCAWLLVPTAAGAPQPPPPAQAQTRDAVAAYESGRFDEALRGFAGAARQGNRLAQFNYAMMLLRGEGTAARPQEALVWLRKAADASAQGPGFTEKEMRTLMEWLVS